jgi:hypothetical protein
LLAVIVGTHEAAELGTFARARAGHEERHVALLRLGTARLAQAHQRCCRSKHWHTHGSSHPILLEQSGRLPSPY